MFFSFLYAQPAEGASQTSVSFLPPCLDSCLAWCQILVSVARHTCNLDPRQTMLSGGLPLRKMEHTNIATHQNLSLHRIQFAELFSRKQDTNFKPNFSKWPTGRTILLFYNTFITVIYMFRATSCSSSGGQIVLIQPLVSSLSHRTVTESDDTRCCINTILPPDDEHDVARNM